jgi:hypothetical protein
MRRKLAVALAVICAGAIVVVLIIGTWRNRPTSVSAVSSAAAALAVPAAADPTAVPAIAPVAVPAPAPADPLVEYEGALSVQSEVSEFVQTADRLPAADRDRRSAELNRLIDDLERQRMIVGAQGLYLRGAIAAAQFAGDPAARDAAIASLKQRYAGATPSTTHLDARFRRLKAREQEIVREADARVFFPNGMTKEQYLRLELDAAVREAYSAVED